MCSLTRATASLPAWNPQTDAGLFRLDADLARDAAPDLDLLLEDCGQLLGRRALRLERELAERLAHVRALEHDGELARQPVDHFLRHSLRAEDAAPRRERHLAQPGFGR